MPYFIEKLGLESLVDTEEDVRGLVSHIMREGDAIVGYYGQPYFNYHFGAAQFIVRAIRNDEEKAFNFCGIDTHSSGHCVWKAQISGMNVSRKDADILERRCVIHRADDRGGMAVINMVNADVLPSYDEDTVIQMQVIAFPSFIEYYKDEEEYSAAQPDGKDGHKWLLGEGTLMPVGLMTNRNPKSDKFETDEELDDLTLIRGTVKHLLRGIAEFSGEKVDTYIRCIIDTEYGELEIVHTLEDVDESQHDNMHVGATVYGSFILSGDPAIYAYENGCVFDEENDLAILRSTFAGNDPERIRYALSENATYIAGYNRETVHGRDAIIDRIKVVQNNKTKYFAHFATLTLVDEGDEPLPYDVGRRCIVLAENEETNYSIIAFIEVDSDGRISKIETSTNGRYHFRIDQRAKHSS